MSSPTLEGERARSVVVGMAVRVFPAHALHVELLLYCVLVVLVNTTPSTAGAPHGGLKAEPLKPINRQD